jgi:hypothetical protein
MALGLHEAEVLGLPYRRKGSPRAWSLYPRRRASCLGLLLLGSTILAEPVWAAMTIGVGTASCLEWTALRNRREDIGLYKDQQWILGFIAGIRFAQKPEGPPRAVNADDLWEIVDDYCAQNPTDRLAGAAAYFYRNHAR